MEEAEIDLSKGIAISDVVNYIEENIVLSESIPICILKDLKQLYQERMIAYGARRRGEKFS